MVSGSSRYNDEVILVGVPAAQPFFPGLGWGRRAVWCGFKVSRISREAGGTDQLGLTCGRYILHNGTKAADRLLRSIHLWIDLLPSMS